MRRIITLPLAIVLVWLLCQPIPTVSALFSPLAQPLVMAPSPTVAMVAAAVRRNGSQPLPQSRGPIACMPGAQANPNSCAYILTRIDVSSPGPFPIPMIIWSNTLPPASWVVSRTRQVTAGCLTGNFNNSNAGLMYWIGELTCGTGYTTAWFAVPTNTVRGWYTITGAVQAPDATWSVPVALGVRINPVRVTLSVVMR